MQGQNWSRYVLARAHLMSDELAQAEATALEAQQYDYPANNHAVSALRGVITLLSGDTSKAREEFTLAAAQASDLLDNNSRNFRALDTKGLALAGLALCGEGNRRKEAFDAYRSARAINRDAGMVRRVLRLFDKLSEADTRGILREVRGAAEGTG
ncbi:MAG TPA: hypothetical protein VIK40_07830 [Geomonas sp.]